MAKEITVFPSGSITLKAARVNANLTLDKAAKSLGTTKQTLISYEKGSTSPTVEKLEEMCKLYGCRMESISFLPSESD